MESKNLHVSINIVIPIKYWYFDWYLKVRESLHTQIHIWISTIMNHIDMEANFN